MLYTDIYSLIVPQLPYQSGAAFAAACTSFRKLFWSNFNVQRDNYLPLRRAVVRQSVTSVAKMLEDYKGKIPVAVLKLALLTENLDILGLLLQHDVEVDSSCLSMAIALKSPELYGALLEKASSQILHVEHIFRFSHEVEIDFENKRDKFTAITRSSSQFRTLLIPPNFTVYSFFMGFPELTMYSRNYGDALLTWHDSLRYMGIDKTAPREQQLLRLQEIKDDINANWIVSDADPYAEPDSRSALIESLTEANERVDGTPLLNAMWYNQIDKIRSIIASEPLPEYDVRLRYFERARQNVRALFLETGFVTLTYEVITVMYLEGDLSILVPLWLKGEGLPSVFVRSVTPQEAWFADIATTICQYWDDVKNETSSNAN